jgi:hypothetical protein
VCRLRHLICSSGPSSAAAAVGTDGSLLTLRRLGWQPSQLIRCCSRRLAAVRCPVLIPSSPPLIHRFLLPSSPPLIRRFLPPIRSDRGQSLLSSICFPVIRGSARLHCAGSPRIVFVALGSTFFARLACLRVGSVHQLISIESARLRSVKKTSASPLAFSNARKAVGKKNCSCCFSSMHSPSSTAAALALSPSPWVLLRLLQAPS